MVGLAGVEPATHGLGNRCSIHLSYRPAKNILQQAIVPAFVPFAYADTCTITGHITSSKSLKFRLSISARSERWFTGLL
jgi:hypothetical protein